MGSAMLGGWLESGTLERDDVIVVDKDTAKASQLSKRFGVRMAEGNKDAAEVAGIAVLAVKPQDSSGVLEDISGAMCSEKVVVSIIAGLSISSMRKKLGEETALLRVMPNMGAQVGASVSGYAIDPGHGGFDTALPVRLLEAIGEVVEVEEGYLDLVTAVSGSGPAYFFLMVESLEKAAIRLGLPEDIARKLSRETLWGAAKVLKESGRDAAELRQAVSSPGGTTLAALGVLEEAGFTEAMSRAVEAAHKRAGELTR
jgi:pyrroline-5-carboxylate reductase